MAFFDGGFTPTPYAPDVIEAMDADHDGVITRDEFQAAKSPILRSFPVRTAAKSPILRSFPVSPEALSAATRPMHAQPALALTGRRATFDALDRDHDGVISRAEFESAVGEALPPVITCSTSLHRHTAGSVTLLAAPMMQQPVAFAASPVLHAVSPALQERLVVTTAPPAKVLVQDTAVVVRQPLVHEAPPPPEIAVSPALARRVEPVRANAKTALSTRAPLQHRPGAEGGRVIGERPITREELAADGHLLDGDARQLPCRAERASSARAAGRAMPSRPAYERTPAPTARLEAVRTHAASRVVESAQAYSALAAAKAYDAPRLGRAVMPALLEALDAHTAQVVQTALVEAPAAAYAAPPVAAYAAPTNGVPTFAYSAFGLLDHRHDGVIDRTEFELDRFMGLL